MALVAQLDRAPACGAGGCGFKPRLSPQTIGNRMDIIAPRDLAANSRRINAEKTLRIKKYLNEALQALVLDPDQTRVEKLFLVKASVGDIPVIEHVMREAGYATVSAIARPAGNNETDVILSFTIPPQGE